ncbi:helix-turn-helix transcriptional regulator [Roseibium sp. MMSF_3412]|uniref:helix-turn-helix transcriptional regulator n=1 Tax=Roseibium sp. MMSF_3412 TaxID=3046712 RepID=UPI00273D1114|nr:helix-turn-helix transcriptional regulator [Roseibium sp. MMSF_3412]
MDHSGLLHKLYSAALLDQGLTGVLSDLATCYPDLPISYQAQCVYENTLYDCAMYNHGEGAEFELGRAVSANPFPPIALQCDPSDLVYTGDFISAADVEKTDFYHEFMKDHGDINRAFGVILHRHGEDSAFVAANLPRTMKWREEEHVRSLFGFLRPHLQNAFGLLLELAKRDAVPADPGFWLNQIPTAAVLALPDGKVVHFNSQAEQFLKTSGLVYTDRTVRLAARTRKLQNQLQSALRKASDTSLPVGPVAMSSAGNGGPFFFVMPVQHKDQIHPGFAPFLAPSMPLLVTMFDPADVPRPSAKILSAAFGLTERECLVIQQLILGASLKEAADTLQISYNTARNHLANATSKTGAHSQADIVRRGTQILAKLGSEPI